MPRDPETAGMNSLQQVNTVSCGTTRTTQTAESFRDTHTHTHPRLLWKPIGSSGKISHFTPLSRNNGTVTQRCHVYNTPGSPSIAHTCHRQPETAGYGIQVCACAHTHTHTHTSSQPPHVRDPAKPGIWYKNSLLQKKSNQNA